jgi:hypothetical protein
VRPRGYQSADDRGEPSEDPDPPHDLPAAFAFQGGEVGAVGGGEIFGLEEESIPGILTELVESVRFRLGGRHELLRRSGGTLVTAMPTGVGGTPVGTPGARDFEATIVGNAGIVGVSGMAVFRYARIAYRRRRHGRSPSVVGPPGGL